MTAPSTNPLQQAAALLRVGKRAEARRLLAQYVRQNPTSENAWLMLSLALDEPKQQVDCLNIVLRINPKNAEARERLDYLTQPPPTPPPSPPSVETSSPEPASASEAVSPQPVAETPAPPEPSAEATAPQLPPVPEAVSPQPSPDSTSPAPPMQESQPASFETLLEAASPEPLPPPSAQPVYTGPIEDMVADHAPGSASPPSPPTAQSAEATAAPGLGITSGPEPPLPSAGMVPIALQAEEAEDSTDSEFAPLILTPDPGATAVAPPVTAPRPSNPVTRVLAVLVGGLLLIVVAIVAAGVFVTLTQQPTPTAAAAVTRLPTVDLTGLAFPTIPPSYTPSVTPTITLTPTITPSPSQTSMPTPRPPGDDLLTQMQVIEQQAVELRQLDAPLALQRNIIDSQYVSATLEELYLGNGGTREAVDDQARVLAALGLIEPGYDLLTPTLDSLSDSADGFYVPQAKAIYLIGADFGGVPQWAYAYDFDHALLDANFDVAGMDITPVCKGDRQRCDAIRALIVGDASLLMAQWFSQHGSPEDAAAFGNYDLSEPVMPLLSTPLFIQRQMAFPYVEGKLFSEFLFNQGGWEQVNSAYSALPQTTEHILHPDRYLAGEPPAKVETPALGNVISDEWRLIGAESLGEWTTYLTLSAGLEGPARVEEGIARQAAAGWGGDVYQAFYNDSTGQTILVVHWAWDSPEDGNEFLAAMSVNQDARFDGARVDRADGDCWEQDGQASCVFAAGAETLWILAPDQPTVNNLLSRFPTFQ